MVNLYENMERVKLIAKHAFLSTKHIGTLNERCNEFFNIVEKFPEFRDNKPQLICKIVIDFVGNSTVGRWYRISLYGSNIEIYCDEQPMFKSHIQYITALYFWQHPVSSKRYIMVVSDDDVHFGEGTLTITNY